MARTTSFALGKGKTGLQVLVYEKTGRLVPESRAAKLQIRGKTVYDTTTGRKAGQLAQVRYETKVAREMTKKNGVKFRRTPLGILPVSPKTKRIPASTRGAGAPNGEGPYAPESRSAMRASWTPKRVKEFKRIASQYTTDTDLKQRLSTIRKHDLEYLEDIGLSPEISKVYDYYDLADSQILQELYDANLNFILGKAGK